MKNLDLLLSNLYGNSVKTFKNRLEQNHWATKQPKGINFIPGVTNTILVALDALPMILGEKFHVNTLSIASTLLIPIYIKPTITTQCSIYTIYPDIEWMGLTILYAGSLI